MALSGRNLLLEGGSGDIAIAAAATPTARAAAQMRSLWIADVRRKVTRGNEMMLRKGEDDPPQDTDLGLLAVLKRTSEVNELA